LKHCSKYQNYFVFHRKRKAYRLGMSKFNWFNASKKHWL